MQREKEGEEMGEGSPAWLHMNKIIRALIRELYTNFHMNCMNLYMKL